MICLDTRKNAERIRKLRFKNRTRRIYHATPFNKLVPKEKVIPLHIYQVWHDTNLPSSVRESINLIKEQNPEFEHHLYDEVKCRKFIDDHFPKKVLHAYDEIPYAIKADLWRYCILYVKGGIYLDSKYYGIEGFKLIHLTDKEYFCKDSSLSFSGIYNAILICKPRNKIMLQCIHKVLQNVENKYYGSTPWCIGPLMVRSFFTTLQFNKLELKLDFQNNKKLYIVYQGHRILKYNEKYNVEKAQNSEHWIQYWKQGNLYRYEKKIPSILFQTSKTPPLKHVMNELKEKSKGWTYMHFTDKEILQFFKDYPLHEFPEIVEKFNSIQQGAHKADLFRYYFLYVKGGVFIDSDAMLQVDLDTVVKDYAFFSVDSKHINPKSIFQGLIGATPKNKIIYEALKDMYTITDEELKEYFTIVKHLYTIYQKYKTTNSHLYFEKWKISNKKNCVSVTYDDERPILNHYPCSDIIP